MLKTPWIPTLTDRYTAHHDWRMPETGWTFRAGGSSYRVESILPRCAGVGRHRAWVNLLDLRTGRIFHECLESFWAMMDRGEGPNSVIVGWIDHEAKARRRHERRAARRQRRMGRAALAAVVDRLRAIAEADDAEAFGALLEKVGA